jgi:hypothetical protein
MTEATYGRYNTGADPDYGIVPAGMQRCYAADPLGTTIIAYEMGCRAGRATSSSPVDRMFITNTSSEAPNDVLGYTDTFTATNDMNHGGTGAGGGVVYERDLTTPLLMASGPMYGLGITSPTYSTAHGMIEAALIPSADNTWFYERGNGSSIPINQDGVGGFNQGHMTVWVRGEINVAPNTPTGVLPTGNLASTDLTPQLNSNFSDDNETLPNLDEWDYLNQLQIEVRRASDLVNMWTTGSLTATQTERDNRQVDRAYAGNPLVAGVTYQHRHRHSDRNGTWSAWSAWVSFTINAGGTVLMTTATPSGKQNLVNPGPLVSTWDHPNPLNADRYIVRIKNADGSVRHTMTQASPFTLSPTVADNGALSMTYAQTAFPNLPRGFSGTWEAQARDTGLAWSPWSAGKAFSINATPNIPTSLTPTGSQAMTQLPKISCAVTDPDDVGTALTVTAEIKRADTSVVTVTMIRNATTGLFEFQLTTTQVPTVQTVQWRAKASDGTSESAYSAYATFIWGSGPVVTIAFPTDEATIAVSGHTISWTVPSGGPQVKKAIQLWELVNSVRVLPAVIDTGDITDAVLNYTVPDNTYRTGKRYELVVTVTNSAPLSGSSVPLQFNAVFVAPEALTTFTATPAGLRAATGSTGLVLGWSPTDRADDFRGYDVYRRALGPAQTEGISGEFSAAVTEVAAGQIHLRRITAAAQTTFIDGNPAHGVVYEYEMRQVVQIGLDTLISDPIITQGFVLLDHVMLTHARYPDLYGVELRHRAGTGAFLNSKLSLDKRKVVPVGGKKGRSIRSPFLSWDDSGTFELITDQFKSADQRVRELTELVELGETCCLRDFLGLRRFVSIDAAEISRFSANRYQVTLAFSEEGFIEGEALEQAT